MSTHLVIGGARSGKSRFAQALAEQARQPVTMIVTAEILDAEMARRVELHRAERPAEWQLVEAPIELPEAICTACTKNTFVLVDCLTLWLSNVLCTQIETLERRISELCQVVAHAQGELVMVSNEVGWGIVPENALARQFRDEQGRLNQRIAAVAQRVTLVAAGLPLSLKEMRCN
jgi:adenosylcobinamide kinase/adenosylcobinamide-phosphate guanylyltransferase